MSYNLLTPSIHQVLATYELPMRTVVSLVEDMDAHLWVIESCPVGTKFWTVHQAKALDIPGKVGNAIRMAVRAAVRHQQMSRIPRVIHSHRNPILAETPLRHVNRPREEFSVVRTSA